MKMALSLLETLSKGSAVRNARSVVKSYVISFRILQVLKYHFNCSSYCVFCQRKDSKGASLAAKLFWR